MNLTVLGVHSPYPHRGRSTVGYTVGRDRELILLDAGFGIYRRLVEEGLFDRIAAIVLSHLHSDHAADLPAIVLGLAAGGRRPAPIPVHVPPGEAERLRQWLQAGGFKFVLDYMAPFEIGYDAPVAIGALQVAMSPAKHSLPAAIISVAEEDKRLVYTGDTADCPGLRLALARADLVLSEVAALPPEEAERKGHLTPETLGALAREALVGRLVITHFMPGSDPEALAAAVAASFGRPVEIAKEGQLFTI